MKTLEESFRILRVTLLSHFNGPSVFSVTSAHRADGSAYVAAGLARAFAETGDDTLLIKATEASVSIELGLDENFRGTLTQLGTLVRSRENPRLSLLSLGIDARDMSVVHDVDSILAEVRQSYRTIIIATDPVPASATAFQFARKADGVLLAVRMGRSPIAADRDLVRLLDESGARTVGVVPTNVRPGSSAIRTKIASKTVDFESSTARVASRKIEVAS